MIAADFLRLELKDMFQERPLKVVASLPYNAATPILFRLLDHRTQFPQATVMLQREVAERITASPGTKAYGVLSVLIQLYATPETVCSVGPRSFFPAPQVHSQVIKLIFYKEPRVEVADESLFRQIVKAAFNQRRKTLRNALRGVGGADLEAVGQRADIDLQRRGETLSLEAFARLTNNWRG